MGHTRWSKVVLVARDKGLDEKKFEAYTIQHRARFGVNKGRISPWFVNTAVKEFIEITK